MRIDIYRHCHHNFIVSMNWSLRPLHPLGPTSRWSKLSAAQQWLRGDALPPLVDEYCGFIMFHEDFSDDHNPFSLGKLIIHELGLIIGIIWFFLDSRIIIIL